MSVEGRSANLVYARFTCFLLLLLSQIWKACICHGNDGQVHETLHSPASEILIFIVEKCFASCKQSPTSGGGDTNVYPPTTSVGSE